jgi:uncharacterized ubiquitin-like protein YukD
MSDQPLLKKPSPRTDLIQIKIKTLNGLVCFLNVNSHVNISSIQTIIEDVNYYVLKKTGVPLSAQRLLHKAVLLETSKSLSEYNINDGDTIQLIANMLPE